MKTKKYRMWDCSIIVDTDVVPEGFDLPPRQAAIQAIGVAGINIVSCSSGWGRKKLKPYEQEIVKRYEVAKMVGRTV